MLRSEHCFIIVKIIHFIKKKNPKILENSSTQNFRKFFFEEKNISKFLLLKMLIYTHAQLQNLVLSLVLHF